MFQLQHPSLLKKRGIYEPNFQLSRGDGTPIRWVDVQQKDVKQPRSSQEETRPSLGLGEVAALGLSSPTSALTLAVATSISRTVKRLDKKYKQRLTREVQYITCNACGHRWTYYQQDVSQLTFKIVATGTTSEELLEREEFTIDNSGSPGEYEKQLSLQKQWSKSLSIAYEKGQKVGSEVSAGLPQGIGTLKANIEETVKRTYTITDNETTTYTEVTTLRIPPRTKIRALVEWKQIWRYGHIQVYDLWGGVYGVVPFKVAVHIRPEVTPRAIP